MSGLLCFSAQPYLFGHGKYVGEECFSKEDGLPRIGSGGVCIMRSIISEVLHFGRPVEQSLRNISALTQLVQAFSKHAGEFRSSVFNRPFYGFSGHDDGGFKQLSVIGLLRFQRVNLNHGLLNIWRQVSRRCFDLRFWLEVEQFKRSEGIHGEIEKPFMLIRGVLVAAAKCNDCAPMACAATGEAFKNSRITGLGDWNLNRMNNSKNDIVMPAIGAEMRDGGSHV